MKDTELLKGVQWRATKLVKGMEHLYDDNRLKLLELTNLDSRSIWLNELIISLYEH